MARLSGVRLLVVNLCALAVNVALMLILVPVLGVWGAVLGNIGAALTQVTILLVGESRWFGVAGMEVLRAVAPFILGGLAGGGTWYVIALVQLPTIAAAAIAGVAGLAVLMLLLRAVGVGLTREDRAAITGSLPAAVRRIAGPVLWLCTTAR
jgi:O-antigen/teichoic acid export membrane protein